MHRILFSRGRAPKVRWAWSLGDRGGILAANSRSEARALIKQRLGLSSAARLPESTTLIKVDG